MRERPDWPERRFNESPKMDAGEETLFPNKRSREKILTWRPRLFVSGLAWVAGRAKRQLPTRVRHPNVVAGFPSTARLRAAHWNAEGDLH
jgi:hypothetical protein